MKRLEELAEQAADRADSIGCSYATQMGEMPSREEVLRRIEDCISALRQDGMHKQAIFGTVAALGLLGAMLEEGR